MELREFDIKQTKDLSNNVAQFLKEKYNFIILKEDKIKENTENINFINEFIINNSNKAIYSRLNSPVQAKDLIDEVKEFAIVMSDTIADVIYEYGNKLEENLNITLNMIRTMVEKFIKALTNRGKNFKIEDSTNVLEMQDEFYRFLQRLLKDNLIERIIPAIYEGMRNGNTSIYCLVLKSINTFLSEVGIKTMYIKEHEKIDYDYCTPIVSDENTIDDYSLKETIKEIRQFPYVFDEGHIVAEGKIVAWRFVQ